MKRLEEIYLLYEQKMYYLAYAILRDEGRAEDAVSEAFLKLLSDPGKLPDVHSPACRSLVMKITKNAAIDIYRQIHRERLRNEELKEDNIVQEQNEIARMMEALDAEKLVKECLKDMPEALKELVRLKYFGQLENGEVAEVLQISAEAVRKRDQRLREYILEKAGGKYE